MKQNTFMITLALVVTFILAACASEEYTDDPIFDQEIKTDS